MLLPIAVDHKSIKLKLWMLSAHAITMMSAICLLGQAWASPIRQCQLVLHTNSNATTYCSRPQNQSNSNIWMLSAHVITMMSAICLLGQAWASPIRQCQLVLHTHIHLRTRAHNKVGNALQMNDCHQKRLETTWDFKHRMLHCRLMPL